MTKVFFENNLFVPRSSNVEIINVGEDTDDYSAGAYKSAGWSSTIYTVSDRTNLYSSEYKTTGSFSLGGSSTISNGGIGGYHPYLSGVTIPSYVGATDPSNNVWVNKVVGLSSISNLKLIGTINSTSSIASTSNTPGTPLPPPPTKLIVIE